MRDFAAETVRFSDGRARLDLDADRMYMLATCRLLEMMGEAAFQLPETSRQAMPAIPWSRIIGLRHRLVHAYDKLDLNILWDVVKVDLPSLISALDTVLDLPSP